MVIEALRHALARRSGGLVVFLLLSLGRLAFPPQPRREASPPTNHEIRPRTPRQPGFRESMRNAG